MLSASLAIASCVASSFLQAAEPATPSPASIGKTGARESREELDTDELRASSNTEIQRGVDELAHESYDMRQAAAKHLLNAGTPARPRLLEAAGSFDPEVRASARRLVLLIDEGDF
ncbi:MAG: hypothetical protein L0Z07_09580, partial [Planctomycetes bacterium]|nr:hypothetical protein [Planctomycetota bacterium]